MLLWIKPDYVLYVRMSLCSLNAIIDTACSCDGSFSCWILFTHAQSGVDLSDCRHKYVTRPYNYTRLCWPTSSNLQSAVRRFRCADWLLLRVASAVAAGGCPVYLTPSLECARSYLRYFVRFFIVDALGAWLSGQSPRKLSMSGIRGEIKMPLDLNLNSSLQT